MAINARWRLCLGLMLWQSVACMALFAPVNFPDELGPQASTCPGSSAGDDCRVSEAAPGWAMLQKGFKASPGKLGQDPEGNKMFKWGNSDDRDHPKAIGKHQPHSPIQEYEAQLPYLTGVVLNIFTKLSNGEGGLLLAMEVPSPCSKDKWIEVDRTRCSKKYPCALRLPAGAVRGSETEPTQFRTRVISEDEDYETDFLVYQRVSLDPEAEVEVAREKVHEKVGNKKTLKKSMQFNLSPVISAGALTVTPVVVGASEDTMVTMRIRQQKPAGVSQLQKGAKPRSEAKSEEKSEAKPKSEAKSSHRKTSLQQHASEMKALETTLQSYRNAWASEWRAPASAIEGCEYSYFEVPADQLYPGKAEVEIWVTGKKDVELSDVVVSTRVNWAEAEVTFLDSMLKDHFGFFNDPDAVIHGLPLDALKKQEPGRLTDSNPTEWGYAMQSWLVMAETGNLTSDAVVEKLRESLKTIDELQKDPGQFRHGLFYPFYRLREPGTENKLFPSANGNKELPCGDVALFYASLMMVQGWLQEKGYAPEVETCSRIIEGIDFQRCVRMTDCNQAGNGLEEAATNADSDKFWSVALTINADTLEPNTFNWNVWADEGGIVAMIVALDGAVNDTQYESIVRQQQRYSPCAHWEGVTVGHAAFFNSIFTMPTRSILGFGTLFTSPYYHDYTVRSVLPSFRAHQKLKRMIGINYIGPSDAMTAMPKSRPWEHYGSYAYWPPNNMYDCRRGKVTLENQCTWCKGIQMEGYDDVLKETVPHGNLAAFLVAALMEKSQFSAWMEDVKLLMTDWSDIYKPGYGFEVLGPANRTKRGERYEGGGDGRGIWESLSHGYIILSMYEGIATMRRRYELLKQEGFEIPGSGSYEPPNYRPLSDILNSLPKVRAQINRLLQMTRDQESQEKECGPSAYGPPGKY